jgi:Rieske Fe-S protein
VSDAGEGTADATDATDTEDPCVGLGEELGRVDEFPSSTYRVVRAATGTFIVSRDDVGLYAYAATCTFAACTLSVGFRDGVATCPCHGDRFDFDGLALAGPATEPLAHYALSVCSRRVLVDATRVVPHTVRTLP